MKAFDIVRTATGNTMRSKMRTLLTVTAIVIGAFTLTLTSGLGAGINAYVDDMVAGFGDPDQIMVMAESDESQPLGGGDDGPAEYDSDAGTTGDIGAGGQAMLSEDDIETIEGLGTVTNVDPIVFVNADYLATPGGERWSLSALGFPSEAIAIELVAGEAPDRHAMEMTVPESWLPALDADGPEDVLGTTVEIGVTDLAQEQQAVKADVVGVSEQAISGVGGIPMPSHSLNEELYALMNSGVDVDMEGSYIQAVADVDDLGTNEAVVKSALEDQGMQGMTLEDQMGTVKGVINAVTWVLSGFAMVALLAASFGIVNTLLMSVHERTREIGLMKALGMSRGKVFGLFSMEAVTIGIMGSVAGVGLGLLVGLAGNAAVVGGPLSNVAGLTLFAVSPAALLAVGSLILMIAFLAGTLPAARAAKKDPIEALRYE